MRKSFKESERQALYNKYWRNSLSVEYSDIYHVLSNVFPQTRFLLLAKFLSVKIRRTTSCPIFFMVYMAMNVLLLMITLTTKKVSIDGL